jgi:hypothetical protein
MPKVRCSFCGRPANEVKNLIANSAEDAHICNRCVEQSYLAISEAAKEEKDKTEPLKRPPEIKAMLDQYVIGQEDCKREVAIAVYEHYRRRETKGSLVIGDGDKAEPVEVEKSNIMLLGPSGCHRRGQLVLMFDGRLQAVERVRVGDRLMGPDSTPRMVLELRQGYGEMAEILPTKGEPWVVNREHILTLVRTCYNGGSEIGRASCRERVYRLV